MNRPSAALALAATVVAVSAAAQQPVRLRFTPPVGQVTRYRIETLTWMQIPGMPTDTAKPTLTRTMFQTRTVTAAQGDGRVVTTAIDSSVQDLGPMSGMMPAGDLFKGFTITQHVDSLGEVTSFDVSAPQGASPMIADALRRQAGQRPFRLPGPRVSAGDTWTSADTMDLGTSGSRGYLDLTYKLDKVEQAGGARVATISMTGSMRSDSAAAAGAVQGQMTGTVVLDLGTSRVMHSTTTMAAQVRSPDGSLMPMRTVSTTDTLP
jgi:hypothetical protein